MKLLLPLLAFYVSLAQEQTEEKVIIESMITNTEIFDKIIVNPENQTLRSQPWFVFFHKPWCQFCNDLMPLYDEYYSNHLI